MMTPPPEKLLWHYGVYQDIFEEYPSIEFNEGLPDPNSFDGKTRVLLVIDDLMTETNDSIVKMFTKISHHKSVSIMYLTQNLFYGSKQNRTLSLNTHYMIVFKNARDATQVAILAKQMYPGKSKFMLEAFQDATSVPYGYLLIDMRADLEDRYRLRTKIFPGEQQTVYVPK
mgnify:FL=1